MTLGFRSVGISEGDGTLHCVRWSELIREYQMM